jgi:hypothetical protein
MALGKGLKGFRVLAVTLLVAAPGIAYGHSLLVSPVPRDTTDTLLKMPNCGGSTATGPLMKGQPVAQYDAGATIPVVWKETIAHGGCFQLRLNSNPSGSDTNEGDFKILAQYSDPPAGTGTRDASVKLPAGVTCANCTLQLLQIMRADNMASCPADASPNDITSVQTLYHSCADIRIGDFPDAGGLKDAGPPDEDASSQDDPGSNTQPTDGGGNTSSSSGNGATGRSLKPADDGGCNVGWGATSGVSFFVSAGIAVMALARRRRKS